jgi:uncharacterized protein with GYD domain
MPKYICFFSYTPHAAKAMIEKPTDRAAAAKALIESVGGKMECFYWMQGRHDGLFIADYKDGVSAAAAVAAAASTGAITQVESHELFGSEAQGEIMRAAKKALKGYKPPTA